VTDWENDFVNVEGREIFGNLGDHEKSKSRTSSFTNFKTTVLPIIVSRIIFVHS